MVRRGDPGRRVGITLLAIAVMLTLFAGRLVQIQGLDSGYYKNAANWEKLKTIVLPALRGTIYSSNDQVLAMTTETYKITADPPQMKAAELPTVAQQLAGPLGLPAAKILTCCSTPPRPSTCSSPPACPPPTREDRGAEGLRRRHLRRRQLRHAPTPTARRPPTWSGSPTSTRRPA